jgi:pimeloyl-ACP methyl ester carboxylesterase
MALAAPSRTRSLTMLACGPALRPAHASAVLAGIDDLFGRGGPMLMWPLLKRVLPKEDQVTRDFWRAKLSTVNPNYLRGVARSLGVETDRSAEVVAAGIPSLVMHGSREKRLWRPDAYAAMASALNAELVSVDQAGHNLNMERPDATAANLLAFWARADARATAVTVGGIGANRS